jgi:hypothetical protein
MKSGDPVTPSGVGWMLIAGTRRVSSASRASCARDRGGRVIEDDFREVARNRRRNGFMAFFLSRESRLRTHIRGKRLGVTAIEPKRIKGLPVPLLAFAAVSARVQATVESCLEEQCEECGRVP